jgi:hypothetical protein
MFTLRTLCLVIGISILPVVTCGKAYNSNHIYNKCLHNDDGHVFWKVYDNLSNQVRISYCDNRTRHLATINHYTQGYLFVPYPNTELAIFANHNRCIGENYVLKKNNVGVSVGCDESESKDVIFEMCSTTTKCYQDNGEEVKGGYCLVYLMDSIHFRTRFSGNLVKLSQKQSSRLFSLGLKPEELLKVFLNILKAEAVAKNISMPTSNKNINKRTTICAFEESLCAELTWFK